MSVLFRIIDLETTGLEPPAEVVEIGWVNLFWTPETKEAAWESPNRSMFRPERGIPPEAMAVHHITMADVADAPVCERHHLKRLCTDMSPRYLVAQNAKFDRQWLPDDLIPTLEPRKPQAWWIDTLKCAKRLWPEAPGHSNQLLRYWLGVDEDEAFEPGLAMPPHRAGPDAYVTAFVLKAMLMQVAAKTLVEWTMMPMYFALCPLGKHRNQPWSEVPYSYLTWILGAAEMDPDIKSAAQGEIDWRNANG